MLLTMERRLTGWKLESFPTFLNTGTTIETLQHSGQHDSFRHLLKSSASMQESSVLQFLRTTTGMPLTNEGSL